MCSFCHDSGSYVAKYGYRSKYYNNQVIAVTLCANCAKKVQEAGGVLNYVNSTMPKKKVTV